MPKKITPFRIALRRTMTTVGISEYQELAAKTGVPGSTLSRWCSGDTVPRVTSLRDLASKVTDDPARQNEIVSELALSI